MKHVALILAAALLCGGPAAAASQACPAFVVVRGFAQAAAYVPCPSLWLDDQANPACAACQAAAFLPIPIPDWPSAPCWVNLRSDLQSFAAPFSVPERRVHGACVPAYDGFLSKRFADRNDAPPNRVQPLPFHPGPGMLRFPSMSPVRTPPARPASIHRK